MMRFAILGPVRGWRQREETDLGSPQQRALLALLLLREGRSVETEAVLEGLWGEQAPRGARSTVRTYVYRLRPILGEAAVIESTGSGYRLVVRDGTVDLCEFQKLTADAGEAHRRGDLSGAAGHLREALEVWRGQALSGLRGPLLELERDRLEELRLAALEELFTVELERGGSPALSAEIRAAVTAHPLRERLHEQLMASLHRTGRRAEALTAYQHARRLLRDALGVDPSPALRGLHDLVLRTDSQPATAETGGEKAPPTPVPAQLPTELAVFTGRRAEIAELTAALDGAPVTPVVGITGLGGMGKTTLAVHLARILGRRFPDGQLFADLAGKTHPADPFEVLGRFLRALGASRLPASLDERAALWRTTTARRRMLIVLDDASDAEQVRPLLPSAPGCAVVVTSTRRIIELVGVRWHRLGVLHAEDALRLLAAIAGADRVLAEQAASARLVAACSHQPLSVHVAAARLAARPSWTVGRIHAQLEDDLRRPVVMHDDCTIVDKPFRDAQARMDARGRTAFHLAALPDCGRLTPAAIAALLDLPVNEATAVMEELVDAHVVETGPDGGYHYLGLIKAFARRQALNSLGGERCREALLRLLRHFLTAESDVAQEDVRAVMGQITEIPDSPRDPVALPRP